MNSSQTCITGSDMGFSGKLACLYFNYVYNRAYDATTARFARYHRLQRNCVGKLEFQDGDRVLCVGLGTGNEIFHIHRANSRVSIVGIDYSGTALRRACVKALRLGRNIEVHVMDAQSLQFAAESFDKALCIHVMDFVSDKKKAMSEIIRVLRNDGQFVITYPCGKEDANLGWNILKDSIAYHVASGNHPIVAFFKSLAQLLSGLVYVPLLLRRNTKQYSRQELKAMIASLNNGCLEIEEDPVYHDFIVYGRKQSAKGVSNA